MKILNIEKIKGKSIVFNGITMYPVKVTYRKWFQKKTLNLFPTNIGPTFGSEKILYLYYADSLGEKYEDISERINTYVTTNQ